MLFELGIILASITTAVVLLKNQDYFEAHNQGQGFHLLLVSAFAREWQWGLLAAFAAGLKTLGLALLWRERMKPDLIDLTYILRQFGWFLSALFWTGMSLSLTLGDFWLVSGAATRAVAVISIGIMWMGPVMPEVPNDSPTGNG